MTRPVLDPQSAVRLVKLCGMLGSQHDGERAAADLKADQLVRGLGLTWGDLIVPPDTVPLRNDWRRMAKYCNRCRGQLSARDRAFIEAMLHWRGEPTERQQQWLIDIYARLNRGTIDPLTQAVERVRRDLDRSIPIKQRARKFWAGVVCSRHLAASDVISSDFQRLADESGLTTDLVKFGGSFNGRETVEHLIKWGLRNMNPFGEKDL